MLCDNEQVRMFTLKASCRQIDIDIASVNGTPFDPSLGTQLKPHMFFSSVVVTTEKIQHMMVANETGLPVEYEWVWVDESLEGDELRDAALQQLEHSRQRRLLLMTSSSGKFLDVMMK